MWYLNFIDMHIENHISYRELYLFQIKLFVIYDHLNVFILSFHCLTVLYTYVINLPHFAPYFPSSSYSLCQQFTFQRVPLIFMHGPMGLVTDTLSSFCAKLSSEPKAI